VSGASGATIEYSLDGGSIWTAYSAAVTLTSEGSYTITARQRSDAAGNWSANATYITVVIHQTTTTSCTAVNSCSATASGSFYVNNGTLSGIYDYFHIHALLGETGVDNSTGCASNSTYISGKGPTGTQSVIIQEVITSSTTFATKAVYYSDTACSSEIASMVVGYDNVSVGDNVTGLTTNFGNITHPSSASKVTYKESCMEVKGTTDVGTAYLNTLLSSSFVTTGQTHTCQNSGDTVYALWAADNSSVLWESLHKEESSTAEYPSDWSSDTDSSTVFTTIDTSLVAYYPFNGNANDESGNSYHGQLGDNTTSKSPTLATDRYGNADKAYSFDGNNDYIALNKYVTHNSISEITVCAWVLSTDTTNDKFIISFDRSESYRLALNDDVNTYVGWDTTDANRTTHDLGTSGSYEDGNWHHICGWFNSSSTVDKKIFVDGVMVTSNSNTHSGRNLGTSDRSKHYGFIGWGSEASSFDGNGNVHQNQFMKGKIDDVRIYSRSLSGEEISALYLSEQP
jgi:hypothetical protein